MIGAAEWAILWPAFVAMTVVDGLVGHARPASGDSESVAAGAIAGLLLNLLAVLLLSRPLGALLRRFRADLPSVVARNYAGTSVVFAVTVLLLAAGLLPGGRNSYAGAIGAQRVPAKRRRCSSSTSRCTGRRRSRGSSSILSFSG